MRYERDWWRGKIYEALFQVFCKIWEDGKNSDTLDKF